MNQKNTLTTARSLSTNSNLSLNRIEWIDSQRVGIKVDIKAQELEDEEDSEADLMELKSKYLEH